MPYQPRRQIKEGSGINWPLVGLAAVAVFVLSVFFGRWLGGEMISGRAAVSPPPAEKETYSGPSPTFSPAPVLPNPSELPRQEVKPSPLQVPPPVSETAPPEAETETESPEESPSTSPSPSVSPSPAQNQTAAGPYKVQVGAFSQMKNAQILQKELNQDGYPSTLMSTAEKGSTYYQVFLGPYSGKNMALAVAHELNLLGYQPLVVGNTPAAPAPAPSEHVTGTPPATASPTGKAPASPPTPVQARPSGTSPPPSSPTSTPENH